MRPTLSKDHRQIATWLLAGCAMVFCMVLIGGITRLTNSGLSMVKWRLVRGSLPPLTDADWQQAFADYQRSPEFQKINFDFGLDDFRSIFWWEYIHRMAGRLTGLVFLLPFLYFIFRKKLRHKLLARTLLILFLGGFQGFLGWYMVKSGLVDKPHVSHYRLAAHLLLAFTVFSLTLYTALQLIYPRDPLPNARLRPLRQTAWIFLALLGVQILWGAFVAGLKAGTIFNTWPLMGDRWIAEAVGFGLEKEGLRSLWNLPAGAQFVHRWIAVAMLIVGVRIWQLRSTLKLSRLQLTGIRVLAAILAVQFCLGILTLIFAVPILPAVLHQAGALCLLGATVFLLHQSTGKAA